MPHELGSRALKSPFAPSAMKSYTGRLQSFVMPASPGEDEPCAKTPSAGFGRP
jgi:hypothetical protein